MGSCEIFFIWSSYPLRKKFKKGKLEKLFKRRRSYWFLNVICYTVSFLSFSQPSEIGGTDLKCTLLTYCFYRSWIWFVLWDMSVCTAAVCVCAYSFKMSCCYFSTAEKSFIKPGSAYIWMNREMEYMVSIWLRRPLTKGAGKAEWQWKLCGFVPHKVHPEGPTSSWNFKQSGAHAAVPSPLESWREMEAFFFLLGHLHIQWMRHRLESIFIFFS